MQGGRLLSPLLMIRFSKWGGEQKWSFTKRTLEEVLRRNGERKMFWEEGE